MEVYGIRIYSSKYEGGVRIRWVSKKQFETFQKYSFVDDQGVWIF